MCAEIDIGFFAQEQSASGAAEVEEIFQIIGVGTITSGVFGLGVYVIAFRGSSRGSERHDLLRARQFVRATLAQNLA